MSAFAQEDYKAVFDAMESEMQRSMSQLRLEEFKPPYFLFYRLTHIKNYSVNCSYGDISGRSESEQQIPFVEARVGSYDFDNTWEGFASHVRWDSGSLHWDTTTIRQTFWYLTDYAYKNALERYLNKKANLAKEIEEDKLPDFSQEQPSQSLTLPSVSLKAEREILDELCVYASNLLQQDQEISFGHAAFSFNSEIRLVVNSEGTRLIQESVYTPYSAYLYAQARVSDGLEVSSFRTQRARFSGALPSKEELARLAKELVQEIRDLKKSPVQLPEVAPAFLDGSSSGVFFHEALGHRLEGLRQREKGELQTFKGKVGQRIIPSFLTVISNPTLFEFQGEQLSGHYLFDSEGVKAQRTILVEKGILKNYLMSRRPVSGFSRSNGNGRSDAHQAPSGRMSVLLVESPTGMSNTQLRSLFLQEIKKRGKIFGFRLVDMQSGEAQTSRGSSQSFVGRPRLIYRVEPNGQETLIRGLEYVGTPLIAIEKILAAGRELEVQNAFCGAESGWVPVTHISPSVVLSELELQRQPEDRFRPPLLRAPLFEK